MNNSNQNWLLEQLPQWEREGLLTAEAAQVLRQRHAVDGSQPGLAQIVMGALGALLIGAGLIAVIGYNWDDFSRPVRLLFAFLPLLASQLASLRVLHRGTAAAPWTRETTALLQTIAGGACIALVSQIYNLGGDWPDFLFWWMLLSLPLVWVLRSHAVAIFYLIATAVWSVNQVDVGNPWQDSPLIYPLLLLGLLPFWPGWPPNRQLSTTLRWIMTPSAIVGLCSAAYFAASHHDHSYYHHTSGFAWLWTLTAAVVALFPLSEAALAAPLRTKPQLILGSLWLLGFGVAATFQEAAHEILRDASTAIAVPWCWGLLGLLLAFAVLAFRRKRWTPLAIASVALLPLLTPAMFQNAEFDSLLSWLATLQLAAIGITLIALEFFGKTGAPRLGATLLSVLVIARMADSHFSLLAKGITFIAVGVAFLAFNLLMSRLLRRTSLP